MGKFDRFSAPCLVNKFTDCTRLTSPGDFNEDFTNAFVALISLACCFSFADLGSHRDEHATIDGVLSVWL